MVIKLEKNTKIKARLMSKLNFLEYSDTSSITLYKNILAANKPINKLQNIIKARARTSSRPLPRKEFPMKKLNKVSINDIIGIR